MISREGKKIPPIDAPIREAIGQPMCSVCVHCLDLCRGIYRRKDADGRIFECDGFQELQPNTQVQARCEAASAATRC